MNTFKPRRYQSEISEKKSFARVVHVTSGISSIFEMVDILWAWRNVCNINLFNGWVLHLDLTPSDNSLAFDLSRAILGWKICFKVWNDLLIYKWTSRIFAQQQISRLESPSYEGHSLSMIRRVAEALGATVRVEIEGSKRPRKHSIAEDSAKYRKK